MRCVNVAISMLAWTVIRWCNEKGWIYPNVWLPDPMVQCIIGQVWPDYPHLKIGPFGRVNTHTRTFKNLHSGKSWSQPTLVVAPFGRAVAELSRKRRRLGHWTASSEFGTYRLCEQRRFRRACASAQSRQNLRCSLIQAVSQEEPSDRKPDPWPLWMAGHAQLKFVMTECSKTQIRLTGLM